MFGSSNQMCSLHSGAQHFDAQRSWQRVSCMLRSGTICNLPTQPICMHVFLGPVMY